MAYRVLRIINRLVIGGPAYNVSYLTKYLEPEFETLLLSGAKEHDEEDSDFIPKQMGIEPKYIDSIKKSLTKPWEDRKAYRELMEIISDFRPHIVHTHAAKAGFIGRLAAINAKTPIVLHTFHGHYFHSYFHPLKTKFLLQIERYLANRTDGIIAISPEQYNDLANIYKVVNRDKIFQIPLGFDLERFTLNYYDRRAKVREEFSLTPDTVAIAIIGRMVPIKNHSLFVKSLARILNKENSRLLKFFFVGDGELRKSIEGELADLNIPFGNELDREYHNPVIFTSWRKDMEDIYAGMDIIALTSLNEGTPVSIIEAQAAKKAIVCTDVGGLRYVVEQDKTALLVPSQDLDRLTNALVELIQNDELREKMGKNGYDFVQNKFSYKRLVSDMGELYLNLIEKKKVIV